MCDKSISLSEWISIHGVSPAVNSEDDFYFILEVAYQHGLEEAFQSLQGIDEDVASYAIEAAIALKL